MATATGQNCFLPVRNGEQEGRFLTGPHRSSLVDPSISFRRLGPPRCAGRRRSPAWRGSGPPRPGPHPGSRRCAHTKPAAAFQPSGKKRGRPHSWSRRLRTTICLVSTSRGMGTRSFSQRRVRVTPLRFRLRRLLQGRGHPGRLLVLQGPGRELPGRSAPRPSNPPIRAVAGGVHRSGREPPGPYERDPKRRRLTSCVSASHIKAGGAGLDRPGPPFGRRRML